MTVRVDGRNAGLLPDRRKDRLMADLVDVGLLFMGVFGRDRGLGFYRRTIVAPHVYQRVLTGTYRQARPRKDPDQPVCAA